MNVKQQKKEYNITPTSKQKQAIDCFLDWYQQNKNTSNDFYLAGYAGTGKTSILKYLIEYMIDIGLCRNISVMSYTGKAVDVLRNKGIYNAVTIHSSLYKPVKNKTTNKLEFTFSPKSEIYQSDLIIIDECSMLSVAIVDDLKRLNRPILLVGDVAQLPSIDKNSYIKSRDPDFLLTEIHRQAEENPIIKLSILARNGEYIKAGTYGNTVLVKDGYNMDDLSKYAIKRNTQPICGMNKTRYSINKVFRSRLGFSSSVLPRIGDKLICCRNNANLGLFNGMSATCTMTASLSDKLDNAVVMKIKTDAVENMLVHADVRYFEKNYDNSVSLADVNYRSTMEIQHFDYAYCLTCHKAQGSEFPIVTVLDESYVFRENAHKWLYTAITRASEKLIILR